MRIRQVLSVVAVALLPVLSGISQGCAIEDDSQQADNITQLSDYELNIAAANQVWEGPVPIVKPEDAWTALVKVGDQTLPAPTHLFGQTINVVPYSNEDGVKDAAGVVFARGDQEIAKIFGPGDVGVSVKHHRPQHRLVDLNGANAAEMKEDFKLQDTHIQLVVGVEKAEHGQQGAITLNNPQNYEDGRFGDPQYSMVFLRPVYPAYAQSRQKEYQANVLATLMVFNSATSFPGSYNGGDPLGAHSPARLATYVEQAVRAIAGDAEAQAWFQEDANLIYCAELAYIALSAGVLEPLTAENLVPRVGEDVWAKFVEQIDIHNKGVDEFLERGSISDENTSNFLKLNQNQRVGMVRIPKIGDLPPIYELAQDPAAEAKKMAFRPMTMADIVRQFMRTHIPRETLGEALAPVQGAVLAKMKPGLLESMAMDQLPATDPRRVAVEALYDQIVQVVGTPYASYQEFLAKIEPFMAKANAIAGPRPGDESGSGLYTPPSLMHVVAQGHHLGGLIGLQYEGHGVHVSAVQKRGEPAPEPTPVDDIDEQVSCRAASDSQDDSCGLQAPGGCWCDDYCRTANDCCADATAVCGGG